MTHIITIKLQLTESCVLNAAWMGDWVDANVEDGKEPRTITVNTFSGAGVCIDQDSTREKHLFSYQGPDGTCYKCLIIFQIHENVLQYKQNDHCQDIASLEICDEIHSFSPLHDLFRHNAVAVNCPFERAPYTFTYSRNGHALCQDPLSTAYTCIEPTQMMFTYNACPNKPETSLKHVQIQCIATWKDGFNNYMVAREKTGLEVRHRTESYRCYQYQARSSVSSSNDSAVQILGYDVFKSEERGTCSHVLSPHDSPNSLFLTVVPPAKACTFPSWITKRDWVILNRQISVLGSEDHTVLRIVQNPHNLTSEEHLLICDYVEHDSGSRASVRVNQTLGCKVRTICMDVHQLTDNVLELVLHKSRSLQRGESCNDTMSEKSISTEPEHQLVYTLIDANACAVKCPFREKYTVKDIRYGTGKVVTDKPEAGKSTESFSMLEIGAVSNITNIHFFSTYETVTVKLISSMYCVAFWKDGGRQYLVAGNAHFHIPGYRCFEFHEDSAGFNVSMRMDDCKSSPESRLDQQTFRLIKGTGIDDVEPGHFAAANSGNSGSTSTVAAANAGIPLILGLQLILIISVVRMK